MRELISKIPSSRRMKEQIKEMLEMRNRGSTFREIAVRFSISRQRVHQLIVIQPKRRKYKKGLYSRFPATCDFICPHCKKRSTVVILKATSRIHCPLCLIGNND